MKKFRQKKTCGTYKKRINIAFFLYTLYILLCFSSVLIVAVCVPKESAGIAGCISLGAALALFFAGSAAFVFRVTPKLKKAQAREDFARGDFSPYSSEAETEIFEHEYFIARYVLSASPFDEDESVILPDKRAINNYLSQFSRERLISEQTFEHGVNASPFFVGYFLDGDLKIRAEKRKTGDEITVEFYEMHRAEFSEKGVTVGGKFYDYETDIQAKVTARFGRETDLFVSIRYIILLGEDGALSFEASSRVAAVINRFGIKVDNRATFDYICADPLKAYEQTALQLVLQKLR
ncbi:MAG: hypothetical protein NC033_02840 [Clostridiales bacterium]|nr:hypothetical protein [Clostridiales bacterium]